LLHTGNPPQGQRQTLPQSKFWKKKKKLQANGPKKQAGVAILISNKFDFKHKIIKKKKKKKKKDKKGHFYQD
jgi:hypothetical protein